MIRVICRTNLDLCHESWPNYLPTIPVVGDIIESKTDWNGFKLSLRVYGVVLKYSEYHNENYLEIELHMTDHQKILPCSLGPDAKGSIRAFYEWYAPLVGRRVSYFI